MVGIAAGITTLLYLAGWSGIKGPVPPPIRMVTRTITMQLRISSEIALTWTRNLFAVSECDEARTFGACASNLDEVDQV